MRCGVRFCGGCNPRYDRTETYSKIKENLHGKIHFDIAEENEEYDCLLVIGGCSNCCAGYEQFNYKNGPIKIWDEEQIKDVLNEIEKLI